MSKANKIPNQNDRNIKQTNINKSEPVVIIQEYPIENKSKPVVIQEYLIEKKKSVYFEKEIFAIG